MSLVLKIQRISEMPTDNNQPPYSDLFDDYVEDYFESGYATFGPEGWEEEPSIPSVRESADVLGMQGAAREYNDTRNLIEVEFEGSRKGIYWNEQDMPLTVQDWVVVEAERGVDLGRLSLMGELVHIKRKSHCIVVPDVRKVVRKATTDDLLKLEENRRQETEIAEVCKRKILHHHLSMKLVDVECQFDKTRITFYFTAEKRVDFRELVKDLAADYKTRIELRQIGARDEARRIGGVGSCGLELCCSGWLMDFKRITTQHAKAQMLPLNPVKLSGQCGRLKCCLLYELCEQ
jgi:cell fate regulator YaaT (PSP1 superfamily)